MKTQISATIVADSINNIVEESRLTSVLCTFPRIILAEVNTHRMLSKSTSSSRAIPFKKMVETIKNDPFIPIAWQKHHSGMQGSEYLDENMQYDIYTYMESVKDTLNRYPKDSKDWVTVNNKVNELLKIITTYLSDYIGLKMTLKEWWLLTRDKAIESACLLYIMGITKQICNRLLEPFMWTTMLITGSREGWDNFFNLRCPVYDISASNTKGIFKSWKDVLKHSEESHTKEEKEYIINCSEINKLKLNKGQAEIHMMALAECIWDSVNESTPKVLQPGEWHIPFENKIRYNVNEWSDSTEIQSELWGKDLSFNKVKVSTAMCANTSYTMVGNETVKSYEKWLEIHDKLVSADPPHSNPLEHCAKAMSYGERNSFIKGECMLYPISGELYAEENTRGWCRNFKGFIPYRHFIES